MWNLDYCTNQARIDYLQNLQAEHPNQTRWDGISGNTNPYATEPRCILAQCQFEGGPGRDTEAAQAWAFELKHYFKRGVGEQPTVTYDNGVYTVIGLIQTTHPHDHTDHRGIAVFT